jgi:hypothetical protein
MDVQTSWGPALAVALVAMLAMTGGCAPQPRSTAYQAVPGGFQSRQALNANYYLGADPAHQRELARRE